MNIHLENIKKLLQDISLPEEEKQLLLKQLADADKQWAITDFKLDRTEKVKKTTAILLEETIEELEQKRKAVEAQNKELEIETALERVRSVAMSMRTPGQLLDICEVLFRELHTLGFIELRNAMINIHNDHKGSLLNYDYADNSGKTVTDIPYNFHPLVEKQVVVTKNAQDAFYEFSFTGNELKDFRELRKSNGEQDDPKLEITDALHYYFYSIGVGSIGVSTYSAISEEKLEVLKRFRNVFDLAYQRYNDISLAEAQAREAKIQLALERVRARTMAMQRSDELQDAANLLFLQVQALDIPVWSCGYNIWEKEEKQCIGWMSSEGFIQPPFKIPLTENPTFIRFYESRKKGEIFYAEEVGGAALAAHYQYMLTLPDFAPIAEKHVKAGFQLPSFQINHVANFTHGNLIFITSKPVPEAWEVFKRFAKVFEQTYTRFLDLQKAEAQAREATIEAALEKVRSRSLAMHKSDELGDVVSIVYAKLKELEVTIDATIIFTFPQNSTDVIHWLANPSLLIPFANVRVPYFDNALCNAFYGAREKELDFYSRLFSFEEKNSYWNYVFEHTDYKYFTDFKKSVLETKAWASSVSVSKNSAILIGNETGRMFSERENDIVKRFGKVFEQAYIRFLDLQNAEAQAREAQVQLALERVRSRSMAMHHSNELKDVVAILFQQLKVLEVGFDGGAAIHLFSDNSKDAIILVASPDLASPIQVNLPYDEQAFLNNPVITDVWHAKETGENIFNRLYTLKEKNKYFDYVFEHNNLETIPQSSRDLILHANSYTASFIAEKNSLLGANSWSHELFSENDFEVLKRIAKVFEQAYTRFLDLQKAEAQAREATIEVALERVRSKAMTMYKSDDLNLAVATLFEELDNLNLGMLRCGVAIFNKEKRSTDLWTATVSDHGHVAQVSGNEPVDIHPLLQGAFDGWMRQSDFSYMLEGEDLSRFYQALTKVDFRLPQSQLLTSAHEGLKQYFYDTAFNAGNLYAFRETPFNEEAKTVMKRFAGVFNLTYNRFLDIQKAEAQTREAKIEAALEKVRSKAMAMHNSQDLADTIGVFYKELQSFSFTPRRCGVGLLNKENKEGELFTWNTTEQGDSLELVGKMKMEGHTILENVYSHWLTQTEYHPVLRGNEIKEYYQVIRPMMAFPDYHHNIVQYGYFFFFNEGGVYAWTDKELAEDELSIYRRFTSALSLTYKRYKDLKHAEANARESQIEAALERVRSRTLAMQKSDELSETAAEVFKQLINLGIEPNRLYIGIVKEETGGMEMWATDEDGTRVGKKFMFNKNENVSVLKLYDGWKAKKKSLIVDMQGKELEDYFHYLNNVMHIPFKGGLTQKRRVQSVAYFSKGFIGMASPDGQGDETILLLERFAAVFNLTFTRFNDLKIAEAHAVQAEEDLIKLQTEKKRAEDALTELQVTQKQLIQSEKMASLGELTAGIAHEIQNPLNFVNNFSEVNTELIKELRSEVIKGNMDEVAALANDIELNSEKINHHGKRADAIVKGMLQHSRSSIGTKEPTDINALCDEYLRLSFHGLRAKDKSFNATIKTDFDTSLEKVNIIPQDIGRVVLNLINNAFYAVNERLGQTQPDSPYAPTVSVSTKNNHGNVEIKVSDNGNGIPEAVKDKIFQPFFTTKPTGQGTGLGLSLSYDIVKAHGGELTVETRKEKGSTFTIQLTVI